MGEPGGLPSMGSHRVGHDWSDLGAAAADRLTKEKREKTQITNMTNGKGDITTEPMGIKKIIMEYYEEVYAHKYDNLNEMDQFLEIHK